jgi:predicted TIM-barrel fold metal-dependent hydrolase
MQSRPWIPSLFVTQTGLCLAAGVASAQGLPPGWQRPPLVDVHVHTSPSHYDTTSDLLAATGVSRFVNLSGGAPGDGLEEALEAAHEYDGRVLVCVNPEWEKAGEPDFGQKQAEMLAQAAAMGARCVKVAKALGLGVPDPSDPEKYLAVDDPRLDPMWAAAGRLGLPVFIHTGDPKAFFEPLSPANERWDELEVHPGWSFADARYPRLETLLAQRDHVLSKHPGTTFIGVHFGCFPENLEYTDRALAEHPNLWVDVAARVPEIGRHDPQKLHDLIVKYQDRVLFGTDLGVGRGLMLGSTGREKPNVADAFLFFADHFRFFETRDTNIPHPTPIQGRWTVNAIGLPADVLAKLYSGNALRLLWREDGPSDLDRRALRDAPTPADYFP